MKSFVAFFALVAVAAADISHILNNERDATIIKQESDVAPDYYKSEYETSNGIRAQESGALKQVGNEFAISASGSNVFTAPNGEVIETSYTADENGYQPKGSHLPTPPTPQPIPHYIQRALDWIASQPPQPEILSKKY